jgi:hypothetical protein
VLINSHEASSWTDGIERIPMDEERRHSKHVSGLLKKIMALVNNKYHIVTVFKNLPEQTGWKIVWQEATLREIWSISAAFLIFFLRSFSF